LQSCLDSLSELKQIDGMSFRKSLKCIFYNLWDEENQRMVSYKTLEAGA
jgi:omega-6 fatty acid desaturase (delta-12 desaturase)